MKEVWRTATDSAAGKTKLAKANDNIEIVGVVPLPLAAGYTTITPGTYTIQPGENMDAGEANFVCAAGGVPCVVTVTVELDPLDADGERAIYHYQVCRRLGEGEKFYSSNEHEKRLVPSPSTPPEH